MTLRKARATPEKTPATVLCCLTILIFSLVSIDSTAHAETEKLEDVLARAYAVNPQLLAERAKLRSVDEQVPEAEAGYRPSIDLTADAGRSRTYLEGNGPFTGTSNLNPHDVGITVTQPVFRGFRTVAGIDAAEATVGAQRAALQDAEQHVLLDAAKAYADVYQAEQTVLIDRDNEDVLNKELIATRDRLRVGERTKTDVAQAESRYQGAKVSRREAEADLANQRATFARVVGAMPETLEMPITPADLPGTLNESLTASVEQNPNVIAAKFDIDAAEADIRSARGSLLPEVSLVGNVVRAWEQNVTLPNREDTATIMARVTVPLYHAGTDYAKTRAAGQVATQRRLEFENAKNVARENAITAWESLTAARETVAGRKAVVASTTDALAGVKEEAKFGARTTLDILNAEQELLDARLNLVKANHDEFVAALQLKAAVGRLTAGTMHLPTEVYDPERHYDSVRGKWIGFGSTDD